MEQNGQVTTVKVALIVLEGDNYEVKLQGVSELEAMGLFRLAAKGIEEKLLPRG